MENTLAVVLGASEWPHYPNQFNSASAFKASADGFRAYLSDQDGLDLPESSLLWLFDSDLEIVFQYDLLSSFLRENSPRLGGGTLVLIYYVGHGAFFGSNRSYCLLARATRPPVEEETSIRLEGLANVLRATIPQARRLLVLDCCFAGAAARLFQGPVDQASSVKSAEIIERGVAVLCAASARDPAEVAPQGNATIFTQSLIETLREGERGGPESLSLRDICELTRRVAVRRYGRDSPRPEIQSPDQRHGDLAAMPLFPNRAYEPSERTSENRDDDLRLELAEASASNVFAHAGRPDSEVREHDGLDPTEDYWVVYVNNYSSRLISNVEAVLLAGDESETEHTLALDYVEPNQRIWYILRPDVRPTSGFDPNLDPEPVVFVTFECMGLKFYKDEENNTQLLRGSWSRE
ncbi:caspase family protein [Actinomycetospora endophytica]|uniref:caspase family protein n=1 Tax=Actinomycetospora endophytica TaxID=2291215 RepID=UPI003556A4E3